MKAKFPTETKGLGREYFTELFGYRINEHSGLIAREEMDRFYDETFEIVLALQKQGGLKEDYKENLAMIENWRATKEGGTSLQQRK